MAWIESHEEIADHKKTGWLAQILECSVPTAVGYVHLLWHYTLKVAWRDGDLKDFIPPLIERACWWDGETGALVKAFRDSGYMDGTKVHDWQDYAKHIIYQRIYNENRKKESKPFPIKQEVYSCKPNVLTVATLPNHTIPTTTTASGEAVRSKFVPPTANEVTAYCAEIGFRQDPHEFLDHYTANGWMRGKTKIKDWKACLRTWKRRRLSNNDEKKPIIV